MQKTDRRKFLKKAIVAGAAGFAILRLDGFTPMSPYNNSGILNTRLFPFIGKYFFVNSCRTKGSLKVEILDQKGVVLFPFTQGNCIPVSTDSTINRIKWNNTEDLSAIRGKEVRFWFHLENGHLYSFWVSSDESGASHGYVTTRGP